MINVNVNIKKPDNALLDIGAIVKQTKCMNDGWNSETEQFNEKLVTEYWKVKGFYNIENRHDKREDSKRWFYDVTKCSKTGEEFTYNKGLFNKIDETLKHPPIQATHNCIAWEVVRMSGDDVGTKVSTDGGEIGKFKQRISYLESKVKSAEEKLRKLQKQLNALDVSSYTSPTKITEQDLSDWSGLS